MLLAPSGGRQSPWSIGHLAPTYRIRPRRSVDDQLDAECEPHLAELERIQGVRYVPSHRSTSDTRLLLDDGSPGSPIIARSENMRIDEADKLEAQARDWLSRQRVDGGQVDGFDVDALVEQACYSDRTRIGPTEEAVRHARSIPTGAVFGNRRPA